VAVPPFSDFHSPIFTRKGKGDSGRSPLTRRGNAETLNEPRTVHLIPNRAEIRPI